MEQESSFLVKMNKELHANMLENGAKIKGLEMVIKSIMMEVNSKETFAREFSMEWVASGGHRAKHRVELDITSRVFGRKGKCMEKVNSHMLILETFTKDISQTICMPMNQKGKSIS